ncbi:hypothetical protein XENTR_v10020495 [Xenopus tropicalis]|nr:forkhead box protein P3 [Xenopus tropicalis]KAE8583365.1 hypothetical protein XENTR_v10020495 [Xenopus tropicalis]KAE8583366.1 hypothetical protein XENTR_v10020495 [Xenopus tropicalis]
MPNPQNLKATAAPSKESETQPNGKEKEQINPWCRRGGGVISQLQQNPGVMVSPSASFSPPSQLQALLEDKKHTVVFHQLSRDTASQAPIIHLSPASSTSILNLQPARLYPVMAKHKSQHPIAQGFNLTSLGWAPQEARLRKPEEVILGKNTFTSSSLCHSPPINTVKTQKKAGGQNKERHLYSDHHLDDKSTVQCLLQTEVVHRLEEKLAVEKQRLHDMQSQMSGKLNTHDVTPSKQRECGLILHPTHPTISPWSSLDLSSPLQKEFSDTIMALRRQLWEGSSLNIFQNMANCMEYYKTNNVRPPFTYASLIRWAILESPQKQLALNEIYHWFTRMFAFFRYNTATWKNAVRHNLSLHKCFVRVENIKGAVWMVDELEFQRKRGVRNSR